MSKTTALGGGDPQMYAYVASTLQRAGRTAHQIQGTMENLTRAIKVVTASVHSILEAYYLQVEAELKWEDEGGAFYDRGE